MVLAGGVWLEDMARWFGITLPIKVLINQLAVTERMPPVMQSVLGIASGLLSLKQYPNGTVLIGGGWQGKGGRHGPAVDDEPRSPVPGGRARTAHATTAGPGMAEAMRPDGAASTISIWSDS